MLCKINVTFIYPIHSSDLSMIGEGENVRKKINSFVVSSIWRDGVIQVNEYRMEVFIRRTSKSSIC